jgi:NDP-sugar pyrophosphorylase family protein
VQTVILAGGLGTRLLPLTKATPKTMAPVRGMPYLEHQLRLLGRQGLTGVVLLTGYLGDQIEDYFGDGSRLGLSIRYSREREPLGTGGALREARHLLEELFLVIYGDSYLPIDYAAVGRRLQESEAAGLIVVYRDETGQTSVCPNVALDSKGHVTRYDKQATGDSELKYVEAGVLAFRRSILDLMPAEGQVSLEQQVYPELIRRRSLLGMPTSQRFYDIGTPQRLKAIEELLS